MALSLNAKLIDAYNNKGLFIYWDNSLNTQLNGKKGRSPISSVIMSCNWSR